MPCLPIPVNSACYKMPCLPIPSVLQNALSACDKMLVTEHQFGLLQNALSAHSLGVPQLHKAGLFGNQFGLTYYCYIVPRCTKCY
jgi:hypothetical protein